MTTSLDCLKWLWTTRDFHACLAIARVRASQKQNRQALSPFCFSLLSSLGFSHSAQIFIDVYSQTRRSKSLCRLISLQDPTLRHSFCLGFKCFYCRFYIPQNERAHTHSLANTRRPQFLNSQLFRTSCLSRPFSPKLYCFRLNTLALVTREIPAWIWTHSNVNIEENNRILQRLSSNNFASEWILVGSFG